MNKNVVPPEHARPTEWPEGLTRIPYWVFQDQQLYADEQARIFLPQNADDPFAAARDGGVCGLRRRRQRLQGIGRREPDNFFDV